MATSTVTAPGQVTLRKEVPQHLGIRPGSRIRLDLLLDGRAGSTSDSNVLLRAFLSDEGQRGAALEALRSAHSAGVGVHSLGELAWVLQRRYTADIRLLA